MRLPSIQGEIERRLLVNYRVDPEAIAALLPAPFRPQVRDGWSVAGICLIRLGGMRPVGLPGWVGLPSENAAHRIAVEWDDPSGPRTGVYIPRRDSDSLVNSTVGGRLFPGAHHRAEFRVTESDTDLHVAFASKDATADVDVSVQITEDLSGSRLFADVAQASEFFEKGSAGFSATADHCRFDGLELHTKAWKVEPAVVMAARSSFFDDALLFPPGTAVLDCALVMRHIPVVWKPLPTLIAEQKFLPV
jgi:Uncharacterized conserved protein (COG2071)